MGVMWGSCAVLWDILHKIDPTKRGSTGRYPMTKDRGPEGQRPNFVKKSGSLFSAASRGTIELLI